MNLKFVLASALLASGQFMAAPMVNAETMMLGKTDVRANVPKRGLNMDQVQKRFGTPEAKLAPAGGDTPLHPVINRWQYNGFTVYFEKNIVIHSVYTGA